MLKIDPKKRISAENALKNEIFSVIENEDLSCNIVFEDGSPKTCLNSPLSLEIFKFHEID